MENATKALIIAGAVLVAIVLISLGVKILSSASGVTKQSQNTADIMTIKTFNSQFEGYIGSSVAPAQVKSLISTVKASNAKSGKTITLTGVTTMENVNFSKTYKVSIPATGGYDGSGYITTIDISANT